MGINVLLVQEHQYSLLGRHVEDILKRQIPDATVDVILSDGDIVAKVTGGNYSLVVISALPDRKNDLPGFKNYRAITTIKQCYPQLPVLALGGDKISEDKAAQS